MVVSIHRGTPILQFLAPQQGTPKFWKTPHRVTLGSGLILEFEHEHQQACCLGFLQEGIGA